MSDAVRCQILIVNRNVCYRLAASLVRLRSATVWPGFYSSWTEHRNGAKQSSKLEGWVEECLAILTFHFWRYIQYYMNLIKMSMMSPNASSSSNVMQNDWQFANVFKHMTFQTFNMTPGHYGHIAELAPWCNSTLHKIQATIRSGRDSGVHIQYLICITPAIILYYSQGIWISWRHPDVQWETTTNHVVLACSLCGYRLG